MSQTQILQPDVSITLTNADREVTNEDQKVLIVGQMVAAGSAVSGELQTNLASTGAPENALFGINSQIAGMIRAFRLINPIVRLDAIGLDDATGTPADWTITVVGDATGAGTIIVTAGSETNHRYEIDVADGDTVTDIADAITAAITADTKCPLSCTNAAGVCTLVADNDGTVANGLGVETAGTYPGMTSMDVAAATPGATDPTLTSILDVATERYQGIVWPYPVTTVLETYLDARFNPANVILDGVGFVSIVDSQADHLTYLNAKNCESLVVFCDKEESESRYVGPSQNEPSYEKSAMFAAIRSLRLSVGSSIARYITSSASLDQYGGPALASLPYFNTPIPEMSTIKSGRGWTAVEIEALLTAGGSVIGENANGTNALVGEVKTTYKTDAAANPDPTFGFLNYVDTASGVREYFFNNFKARFAQSRLTGGAVSRGRDMANEVIIRAYGEQLYRNLSSADYVLVRDGEAAFRFFKDNQTVALNLTTGSVTITMLVPIVTQLRTILATIRVAFSTEG